MRQSLTSVPAAVWFLVVLGPASTAFAGSTPGQDAPRRAPLPDERLGVRTAPLLLLSRPDVCADLGLSARQVDDAEAAISDLYVRAAALKGQVGQPAVAARKAIDEALAANSLDRSAIDWLVPHQANMRIIQATARKLDLPLERVITTVQDHGNTSAASVPLALDTGVRDGRIKRGDLLLLEAFGGGITWGSALIRY